MSLLLLYFSLSLTFHAIIVFSVYYFVNIFPQSPQYLFKLERSLTYIHDSINFFPAVYHSVVDKPCDIYKSRKLMLLLGIRVLAHVWINQNCKLE